MDLQGYWFFKNSCKIVPFVCVCDFSQVSS